MMYGKGLLLFVLKIGIIDGWDKMVVDFVLWMNWFVVFFRKSWWVCGILIVIRWLRVGFFVRMMILNLLLLSFFRILKWLIFNGSLCDMFLIDLLVVFIWGVLLIVWMLIVGMCLLCNLCNSLRYFWVLWNFWIFFCESWIRIDLGRLSFVILFLLNLVNWLVSFNLILFKWFWLLLFIDLFWFYLFWLILGNIVFINFWSLMIVWY